MYVQNTTMKTPALLEGQLEVGGVAYRYVDLPSMLGPSLAKLPFALRVLFENVARNMEGAECDEATSALLAWLDTGTSEAEIAFQPGRVLMHDTTSTPALVDIAAMRDALAEVGADPAALNPVLPVDSSVDHSLAVEVFAQTDAAEVNLKVECTRNAERYSFLRWASKSLDRVRIHPPGTGIMHTINLEQLATVVTSEVRNGVKWVIPDTLIGTDSHTPMINGIGVLGWGVGGLEAQTVMFGMPVMQRIPDVIGVRFHNALRPGVLATDLALTVTQRLRAIGVSGEFVEYFGPGVATLSAGERAVVANMAPEYGATTGFFPIDDKTLTYLISTGRSADHVALVGEYAKRVGLWFDEKQEPRYTRTIDVDLASVGMHIAGPRRPQDLLAYTDTAKALAQFPFEQKVASEKMPRYPVAIAAITSCTNTSDPSLLITAGLVARKARAFGLSVAPWTKTSLAPGSPAAAAYLERCGLTNDLAAVGFDIVGFGCTTCIGNPGPLTPEIRDAITTQSAWPVAMLSGNRNFPGRIHPDLNLAFIMSPPLVVAFALARNAEADLERDPVQVAPDGTPVYLKDLWPSREEVAALLAKGTDPRDYRQAFATASANPIWASLPSSSSPQYPWNEGSTALRRPPFASLDQATQLGCYDAFPLLVLGDDVTTDHISPASAIPKDSFVADFLVSRGDDRNDLNVFASRRGNWEVMVRAAFFNKTLINLLQPDAPTAHTVHVPSGDIQPIFEVADRYRKNGDSVVLIAGERYGTGSSRDWAAKGQRLLGIRAVIALSFERIHRSNLIGMGILPLRLPQGVTPQALAIQSGDKIHVHADPNTLAPRCKVAVRIVRRDRTDDVFEATAAVETRLEVELLQRGGVIPTILQKTLAEQENRSRLNEAVAPPHADPV